MAANQAEAALLLRTRSHKKIEKDIEEGGMPSGNAGTKREERKEHEAGRK